jgi:hypothetical protein
LTENKNGYISKDASEHVFVQPLKNVPEKELESQTSEVSTEEVWGVMFKTTKRTFVTRMRIHSGKAWGNRNAHIKSLDILTNANGMRGVRVTVVAESGGDETQFFVTANNDKSSEVTDTYAEKDVAIIYTEPTELHIEDGFEYVLSVRDDPSNTQFGPVGTDGIAEMYLKLVHKFVNKLVPVNNKRDYKIKTLSVDESGHVSLSEEILEDKPYPGRNSYMQVPFPPKRMNSEGKLVIHSPIKSYDPLASLVYTPQEDPGSRPG